MHRYLPLSTLLLSATSIMAAEPADTTNTTQLEEVVVEGQMQRTSATVSTYIPTSKQKKASQTGIDLINRMAIPQLRPSFGDSGDVSTVTGQSVDVFIDFQPASSDDLAGMRMSDVKKVEYYDNPTDPRFLGKAHVINFIMQKYEYGGYVKSNLIASLIANSGKLNVYSKLQYKKMTYDIGMGGYYGAKPHSYSNTYETYRLPQPDGSVKAFDRISEATDSKYRNAGFWPSIKALYATDKISLQNTIGMNFSNTPDNNYSGTVRYIPSDFESSGYSTSQSNRSNTLVYYGYWNFILPKNNTINFSPRYIYTHTRNESEYVEQGMETINNFAKDNSHRVGGMLTYLHSFGKAGSISLMADATYTVNKTIYRGNSYADDTNKLIEFEPLVKYSVGNDRIYANVTAGWSYQRNSINGLHSSSSAPAFSANVQYSPNSKHSVQGYFGYSQMDVSGRSSVVIQENPLLSYTGNPNLDPMKSFNGSVSYTWLPSNRFNLSVFGSIWAVGDRAAYRYEASPTGILRTTIQPAGNFCYGSYGAYATLRLLQNSLQLSGSIQQTIAHNGYPYDWTKSHITFSANAAYYKDNWNFGVYFNSSNGYPDGCVVGDWFKSVSAGGIWVGWANSSWNLKCFLANPYRWNWLESTTVMKSQYYDKSVRNYGNSTHCFVQISATYTFGFGKKIQIGNEVQQVKESSSGILK